MAKNNILTRTKLKKARTFLSENKLDEARTLLQQVYNSNKSNHEVALELAVINRRLGQFNETAQLCTNVLNTAPDDALAHHILGSAYQCLGDPEGAIKEYNRALKLNNNLTETYYFLGNLYREIGKLELAAENYANTIKLNPNFFEALNNYGAVLVDLHKPYEAIEILQRAQNISPNSCQVLCNIANYYMLMEATEDALNYAKKSHFIDPAFFDALKILGYIYYKKNDYDKALDYYNKAMAIKEDVEITGYIASILERRSEFEAAHNMIKPLIDAGTVTPIILLTYSALSRKYDTQHQAIEGMEQMLADESLDTLSRIGLHSELGKQYDALEEYDRAFSNYQQANLLERDYNKQMQHLVDEKVLDNVKPEDIEQWYSLYDRDFWKSLPRSGCSSERPVFVVAMPRSGTTLMEQILASHPDIQGVGELRDINDTSYQIGHNKAHDKSPRYLTNISQQQLASAADKYLATLDKYSTSAKRCVDKMPANFYHIGLISLMFPNARIIHMIRDPRDICLSIYFQRFGAQLTFSTDLVELADYCLSYQHIMKYWHQVLEIPILDVVYEDLVSNQEEMTRKIVNFCGVEWNDQCLSFYKNKRDINTPSYDQVRKPMYNKSVARWKHYEEHLKPLTQRLGLD